MKKNKFILTSVAALMAVSPMLSFGSQAHMQILLLLKQSCILQ